MSLLKCSPNRSYSLLTQNANLFRQCNDMTEGYRRNVSRSGHLYPSSCHWFLFDSSYTWRKLVNTSFSLDITALFFAIISPILASIGYFITTTVHQKSRILSISTFFAAIPIIITMHIIHSTNIREPKTEEQQLYFAESGWCLICAFFGCGLMGLTCHICMLQHRRLLERQRSQSRRRQLQNALMSSCRQDIAMAIRARMTVI